MRYTSRYRLHDRRAYFSRNWRREKTKEIFAADSYEHSGTVGNRGQIDWEIPEFAIFRWNGV